MRGLLVRWLVSALALWLTSRIVPGIRIADATTLLVAAAMIGILNAVVRPIFVLLTLPITVLTLGLFILVINALMLRLASVLVPGFEVHGFFSALFGWLLLSFFTLLINALIGDRGGFEVIHVREVTWQ